MDGFAVAAGAALALMAAKGGQPAPAAPVAEQETKAPTGQEPRGIRNRNPGNVTVLGNGGKWRGQIGEDRAPDGHAYAVFDDFHNGLRACARLLANYQRLHGLRTPREIINRYAPPSANPTDQYAQFVANALGVRVDEPLDLRDDGTLVELVRAVVRFECGYHPFSAFTIMQAVSAAR